MLHEKIGFCLQIVIALYGSFMVLLVGSICLLVAEFMCICVKNMKRRGDSNPSWAPCPSLHGSFRILNSDLFVEYEDLGISLESLGI
jgi:hypothetical protein